MSDGVSSNPANPFSSRLLTPLEVDGRTYQYYSIPKLADSRTSRLPYSIKVLLESALRNADGFSIGERDVESILAWEANATRSVEIPFKPARVLMQDFTGVPAVVDLAAMRDAMHRLGGDASVINPLVPADLVVDHSVQVDFYRSPDALEGNLRKEMERNSERFAFLKWSASNRTRARARIRPHHLPSSCARLRAVPSGHTRCTHSQQRAPAQRGDDCASVVRRCPAHHQRLSGPTELL